jgi:hypothetical protein
MTEQSTQAGGNTTSTASAQPGADGATTTSTAAAPAAGAPAAAAAPAPVTQQASTGQSTEAAKPGASAEGQAGTQAGTQPAGAPEKYEFKVPAGVSLSEAVTTEFSAVAKELNLSQDAAQKVIERIAPKLAEGNANAISEAMKSTVNKWAQDAKVDPEYGGDKLDENLAVAAKAVERFASPGLRALLAPYHPTNNPTGTGLGNHPELVRMFWKAGKAISEDKPVAGGADPGKGARNAAEVLYPSKA